MIFLRKSEVLDLHRQLIAEFGGSHGLLEEGALESALVAAENRLHYEAADTVACAAAYAWHLTNAHAFVDGNKRVGATVTELFLNINGYEIQADDDELEELYMGVAAGRISRTDAEQWLRRHVRPAG
jgi:death-on-curing protein